MGTGLQTVPQLISVLRCTPHGSDVLLGTNRWKKGGGGGGGGGERERKLLAWNRRESGCSQNWQQRLREGLAFCAASIVVCSDSCSNTIHYTSFMNEFLVPYYFTHAIQIFRALVACSNPRDRIWFRLCCSRMVMVSDGLPASSPFSSTEVACGYSVLTPSLPWCRLKNAQWKREIWNP